MTLTPDLAVSMCEKIIHSLLSHAGLWGDVDAYQTCVVGVLEAFASYKADRGTAFTSFAYVFIKGAVCEYAHKRDLCGMQAEGSERHSGEKTREIAKRIKRDLISDDSDQAWADSASIERYRMNASYAESRDHLECLEAFAAFAATLSADDRIVWDGYMAGNLAELARELGVSRQTISQRWRRIEKACAEFIGDPRRFRVYEALLRGL